MVGDRDMLEAENHLFSYGKNPPTAWDLRGANLQISATIHSDCASIRLWAERLLRFGLLVPPTTAHGWDFICGRQSLSCRSAPQDITSRGPTRKGPAPSQTTRASKERKAAPEKKKDSAEEWAQQKKTAGERKRGKEIIYIFIILL